jgi:hypothetical protein
MWCARGAPRVLAAGVSPRAAWGPASGAGEALSARAWATSGAVGSHGSSRRTGQRGDSLCDSLAGARPYRLPPGCPRLVLACQPPGGALELAAVARARWVAAVGNLLGIMGGRCPPYPPRRRHPSRVCGCGVLEDYHGSAVQGRRAGRHVFRWPSAVVRVSPSHWPGVIARQSPSQQGGGWAPVALPVVAAHRLFAL